MATMRLPLEQPAGGEPTRLDWDPEIGRLGGPAARQVRQLVDTALRQGSVTGHPMPTDYDVTDPLHSRRDMALVLGQLWRVPPALADDYPAPPGEPARAVAEDEAGGERPLDLIF